MSASRLKEEKLPSEASTKTGFEKESEQENDIDKEQGNESNNEPAKPQDVECGPIATQARPHPRQDLPTWKWICTIVALGLGAMLYGIAFPIPRDSFMSR